MATTSHSRSRKVSSSTAVSSHGRHPPSGVLSHPHHLHHAKIHQRVENTYQIEPTTAFPKKQVHDIAEDTLKRCLGDIKYNADECKKLCNSLCTEINKSIKQLNVPRYKIVTTVSLGESGLSAIRHASRSVWNPQFDTFIECTYNNGSVFAVLCVFALYYE